MRLFGLPHADSWQHLAIRKSVFVAPVVADQPLPGVETLVELL